MFNCIEYTLLREITLSLQHNFQEKKSRTTALGRILFSSVVMGLVFHALSHYQTTNFRLFQTERVCRRQFQIWRKWQKVIQTDRKQCGKRKNCSLWAISPFLHCFQKTCSANAGLFGKGLIHENLFHTGSNPLEWFIFQLCINLVANFHVCKNFWVDFTHENHLYQYFLFFPQCFHKFSSSRFLQIRIIW